MKDKLFPSLTVQRVPRWVREALRLEARTTQRTPGDVLAAWARAACPDHLVRIAEARAAFKTNLDAAPETIRSNRELLAYLRQPLAVPASRRERLRAAAWAGDGPAPADPGTGTAPAGLAEEEETRFAPIRLAPGEEA